jgi:ectoine hydroxylase-related dioxygenase (phytanoyl-CoA dioxygenase family)
MQTAVEERLAASEFPLQISITAPDVELFQQQGFLIVKNVIQPGDVARLRDRFPLIFAGKFDTGVYPDEWYWREGMSLPDVTRHMGNAWKSDLTIAKLVLSRQIASAVGLLTGWDGVRLGQDTIWWKAPKTKAITLHQDTSFLDYLEPQQTATCWVALDDTARAAGTIEYVPGSHKWPVVPIPDDFHAPDDYRANMKAAARNAGVAPPEPVFIEVPAGSVVFHAGETWHGSGPNDTSDRTRRSIGIHYVPTSAEFSRRRGGYIYRRYQLTGSSRLDESFFPVLWSKSGPPTAWLEAYLRTGIRT